MSDPNTTAPHLSRTYVGSRADPRWIPSRDSAGAGVGQPQVCRHAPEHGREAVARERVFGHVSKEPLLSRARRGVIVAAAGYLASPIDLVPGVIPVLGQLDDVAFALAALRLALAGLSPERRRMHLDAVASRSRTSPPICARSARPAPGSCARRRGRRRASPPRGDGWWFAARRRPERSLFRGSPPSPGACGVRAEGSPRRSDSPEAGRPYRVPSPSQSTQRAPSHQRCQVVPSAPAANTSSRSALQDDAAGVGPSASSPPSDSHGCQEAPSQ